MCLSRPEAIRQLRQRNSTKVRLVSQQQQQQQQHRGTEQEEKPKITQGQAAIIHHLTLTALPPCPLCQHLRPALCPSPHLRR
nr:hypothetical protein CFP56_52558 [Quercus suber]